MLDTGRRLRSKTAYVLCSSVSKEVSNSFISAFEETFEYLGMFYGGYIHANCDEEGIDHIHVYVSDRKEAAIWYEKNMGLKVNPTFKFWAESEQGPLMIEDGAGNIHLALFKTENLIPSAAIAFKTDGSGFLAWKSHLEESNLLFRCNDHTKS
jgi:hypothetical protein